MKCLGPLLLALALPLAGAAQVRPDYLTPEEVEKVRDARDPNQRAELFLEFAHERLQLAEKALASFAPGDPRDPEDFSALLDDYVRALDDTANTLDVALRHGGVDLSDTREKLAERTQDFLARLERVQPPEADLSFTLKWNFEEALMATRDLKELAAQLPEELLPPRAPTPAYAGPEGESAPQGPPGRPTLRRKGEKDDDRR